VWATWVRDDGERQKVERDGRWWWERGGKDETQSAVIFYYPTHALPCLQQKLQPQAAAAPSETFLGRVGVISDWRHLLVDCPCAFFHFLISTYIKETKDVTAHAIVSTDCIIDEHSGNCSVIV
jgi:hypothetical protein